MSEEKIDQVMLDRKELASEDDEIELDVPFYIACPTCERWATRELDVEDLPDSPFNEGPNSFDIWVHCEECKKEFKVVVEAYVRTGYTVQAIKEGK